MFDPKSKVHNVIFTRRLENRLVWSWLCHQTNVHASICTLIMAVAKKYGVDDFRKILFERALNSSVSDHRSAQQKPLYSKDKSPVSVLSSNSNETEPADTAASSQVSYSKSNLSKRSKRKERSSHDSLKAVINNQDLKNLRQQLL